jgi:lysophospholipase L1-like esterase
MIESSRRDTYRRIVRSTILVSAIAVSSLVFPSALLWMVSFWLAVASVLVGRNRAAWLPLAVCVVVLLVKQPDWSPALTSLAASMAVAAAVLFGKRKSDYVADGQRRLVLGAIGLLWVLWFATVWESYSGSHCGLAIRLDPSRPIACIGDSLTTGLSDDEAYPVYLEQLVTVPVLNFGRAGITARDAIKHLPALLESHPQVVIVELGGHDYLRGCGRAATRDALVRIIEACRDAGVAIVLVEIPRGFITDSFSGLERELARTYDLELISDTAIRTLVLRNSTFPLVDTLAEPRLSDDGLHPNPGGARFLAEVVRKSLERLYGPEITAPDR